MLRDRGERALERRLELTPCRAYQCTATRRARPYPRPIESLSGLIPCLQELIGLVEAVERRQRLDRVRDTRVVGEARIVTGFTEPVHDRGQPLDGRRVVSHGE